MSQQPIGASFAVPSVDQLVTGEAVALELPAASFGLRIASGLIDVVVQALLLFVGLLFIGFVVPDRALGGVYITVMLILVWVIGPAVLETLTMGRTLGKLALGLRTVRDDAGPISFHHAFVRHLLSVVEIWSLSAVPAMVTGLVSAKGKRLGDYLAGTYVVRDRVPLRLPAPVHMPPQLAWWASSADIAPLPESLAVTLRQLAGRTTTLTPQAREQLVGNLVGQLRPLVSPPPPTGTHPEDFLAAVVAERRRRDQERLHREDQLRARLLRRA